MNKLLDKYLCQKYPKIFADRNKPMNQTCMCWGFEFNDGWLHLMDNLCWQIQSKIDNPAWNQDGKIEITQVVALQCKEKFGRLRFYYSGGDEAIRGMVDFAETLSGSICEDCGKMDGSVGHTQGWIKTCCEKDAGDKIWKNTKDKKLLKILSKLEENE